MIDSITSNPRIRRGVYIFLALLIVVMLALTGVQLWVLNTTTDMTAYGSVQSYANGLPDPNQSGAYIILNDGHNPLYQGNILDLLATTDPGVVDPTQGAHLISREIKSLLIQSAQLGDSSDYRVYRIGDANEEPMKYDMQPGNKLLFITPQNGQWAPGDYMVDIPSEGMFGGRTYFEFFVDPEK